MVDLNKNKSIDINNDIDLSDINDNKKTVKYIIIGTIITSSLIFLIAIIIGITLYATIHAASNIDISIIKSYLKDVFKNSLRPIIVAIITMISVSMIYNFAKLLYT